MENLPPGVSCKDIDEAQGDFGECSECGEPVDGDGICQNPECRLYERDLDGEAADDAGDAWRDRHAEWD